MVLMDTDASIMCTNASMYVCMYAMYVRLLKVELRNGKVDRLTDSKYWAYIHTPRQSRNQDEPLAVPKTFVVIVCNANYLEKCLSVIEDGVKKTISRLIEQAKNSPHSILYEIYSQVSKTC
jgi:hypothetical protein